MSRPNNVAWAEVSLPTKWHLDLSSRLGIIDMDQKVGLLCRGLPPYEVDSRSIQPFGHNRHGPKIGRGV